MKRALHGPRLEDPGKVKEPEEGMNPGKPGVQPPMSEEKFPSFRTMKTCRNPG